MSDQEKSWPELGSELGRKGLDVISAAASKLEDGEISERELWLIADAVYDCMAGIAPWDDANVIYAVRQGLSK